MTVYRNKAETNWISSCRFKDANGAPKRTTKRGFKTKEEAEEWERRLKSESNIRTLTLSEFFMVYARDISPGYQAYGRHKHLGEQSCPLQRQNRAVSG